jgi:hypothetical protein
MTPEQVARNAAYKAEWQRQFRRTHRDIVAARNKKNRSTHRDKLNANDRAKYAMNREKGIARSKAYRELHKEELAIKRHAHYLLNRDVYVAYHRSRREKARERSLQRKYGISLDKFKSILDAQGGKCAICFSLNWHGRQPCIDHDHKSGKVRGILCHKCNLTIGMMGENAESVKRLWEYLQKFNAEASK